MRILEILVRENATAGAKCRKYSNCNKSHIAIGPTGSKTIFFSGSVEQKHTNANYATKNANGTAKGAHH